MMYFRRRFFDFTLFTMRHIYLFALLTLNALQVTAQNVNLDHRSTYTFTGQTLSNIWGYSAGGEEYALVGAQNGLTILKVTDPTNPVFIVQIPATSSSWREVKTYQNFAYVVSEHGANGCQIINLTNLPGSNLSWHNYNGDGAATGLTKAHALQVDEVKGYLYLFGSNLFSGKALCFNLNADPYNPTYAGKYDGAGYVHDGYANNDILYPAHIYAGTFAVVDMSNKSAPVTLGSATTPDAFTHNTWLSGSTIFTTDEKSNSYLASYNVTDPGNMPLLDKIQMNPGSGSIVHNTYIHNNYAVTSWYRDGVVVVDVNRPANMVIVGSYDTYPGASGNGFDGCWGVYPYFPSGNIIASNIKAQNTSNGEMWVFTPNYVRGCYLEGQVTNATNGQPINSAAVQIMSTSTSDNTTVAGNYKMGQRQSGSYTVRVSKTGFTTQLINNIALTNGVLTTLNVALQPVPPAPVELVRFDAKADGHDAVLIWQTASEVNNQGFDIQHRTGSDDWRTIGQVDAKEDGETGASYDFRVANLSAGEQFFRLRQTDHDGKSTFSDQRRVRIEGDSFRASLRTNPVQGGQCTLDVFSEKPATLRVEIFNHLGQKTGDSRIFDLESGNAALQLFLADLPSGTYRLAFRTEQDQVTLPMVIR